MDNKSVTSVMSADGEQSVRTLRSNRSGYFSSNGSLGGVSSGTSTSQTASIAALLKGTGDEEGLYLHKDLHKKKGYIVGRVSRLLKQRWYKPSYQVTNFAQLPSLQEVSQDGTLAAKRSNVLRTKLLIEDEVTTLNKKNDITDEELNKRSKEKINLLFHKVKEKILWANPPIVSMYKEVIVGYCEHLLTLIDTPPLDEKGDLKATTPYKHVQLLECWTNKYRGTASERVAVELEKLVKSIRQTVLWRDRDFYARKARLIQHETETSKKKESRLRWMIETNIGRKDRFYTIWYLSQHGLLEELQRFVSGAHFKHVDERDPDHGMTALHYACKSGHEGIVRFLLTIGADPNQRIPDGRTALHFAGAYSSKEIIYELLAHCADVDARDDYGCRAIDLARQNKNDKVCAALEGWGGLIPEVCEAENVDSVESVSEEYTTTDINVIARMSSQLKTLTRRLEGVEGLSVVKQVIKMEPLVEVRLCEKHARLCLQEGFKFEAYKSLRRRWKIVKCLVSFRDTQDYPEEYVYTDRYASESSYTYRGAAVESSAEDCDDNVKKSRKTLLNCSAAADIGLDFAEVLIEDKIEGFACCLLKECLKLEGLEITKQIVLLVRCVEVQLCMHDLLEESRGRISIRTQMTYPQKAQMAHRAVFFADGGGESEGGELGDDDGLTVGSGASSSMISHSATPWHLIRHPQQKLRALLIDCMMMLRRALTLHSIMYCDDIVEPCTLSPLLELLGDVAERQGLLLQSLDLMAYAHVVCCRTLGPSSEEAIRVGLQALRLQMRATTTFEGVKVANNMSKELGNNLNILARTNELAANRLSTRCAVLSLSRMFNSSGLVDGSVKVVTVESIRMKDELRLEMGELHRSKVETKKRIFDKELKATSKAEEAEAAESRDVAERAASILRYDPLTDGIGPSRYQSFDTRQQVAINVQTYDFGSSYEDVTGKYFESFEMRGTRASTAKQSPPPMAEQRGGYAHIELPSPAAKGSLAGAGGASQSEDLLDTASINSKLSKETHGWYL